MINSGLGKGRERGRAGDSDNNRSVLQEMEENRTETVEKLSWGDWAAT